MKNFHYQNIYQFYKNVIVNGDYMHGDLLPSESEMCRQFNVTRMTIRQALDLLVQDGLIIKHKGKGSIVQHSQKSLGLLNIKGFSGALGEHHKVRNRFITGVTIIEWPIPFFFELPDEERNSGCIFFKRVRMIREQPIMLENTYLPRLALEGFADKPFVNGSLFATLEKRYQARVVRTEQNLRAIPAEPDTASLLNIAQNAPVLQIFLKFTTTIDHITIYSNLICNTQDYYISNMMS